jgi:hypothetical protein
VDILNIHHLQYSPLAIFTTCNIHHLQYSPLAIFTTCNIHHLHAGIWPRFWLKISPKVNDDNVFGKTKTDGKLLTGWLNDNQKLKMSMV